MKKIEKVAGITVLEKIRKGCKLSRKNLSLISGVNHMTIYNIERRGYTRYSKTTMEKLAKALEVPVSFFL
jgi:transcriptional regulator with XRE-family HTH domain